MSSQKRNINLWLFFNSKLLFNKHVNFITKKFVYQMASIIIKRSLILLYNVFVDLFWNLIDKFGIQFNKKKKKYITNRINSKKIFCYLNWKFTIYMISLDLFE